MGHSVRLFAGPILALSRIAALLPGARIYVLTPGPQLYVLPLDDDHHDALHAVYGTGDWLESGPCLTTTDLEFGKEVSRGTLLAYLETDYFGGVGSQSAVLWREGALAVGPVTVAAGGSRPRSLMPINAVLRAAGVIASSGYDEFDTIGLGLWRSNDAICAGAIAITD
jgi:hypothetical protein